MSCIRTHLYHTHTHTGLHRTKFQQPEWNKGSQNLCILLLFNLYPKNIFIMSIIRILFSNSERKNHSFIWQTNGVLLECYAAWYQLMATKLCRINQYFTLIGWIAANFIISYYGCQKNRNFCSSKYTRAVINKLYIFYFHLSKFNYNKYFLLRLHDMYVYPSNITFISACIKFGNWSGIAYVYESLAEK